MGPGGTCGGERLAGALKSVANRDRGSGTVRHHHRDDEGRDSAAAFFREHERLTLVAADPADPRADEDPDPLRIGLERTCLGHCFLSGGDGELLEAVRATGGFGVLIEVGRVEVVDFALTGGLRRQ